MAKRPLVGGALLTTWLLTLGPSTAQSPSDAEKIERLERQTELLQKQLRHQNERIEALQQEIRRTRKKAATPERLDQTRKADRIKAWETSTTSAYPEEPNRAETYNGQPLRGPKLEQVRYLSYPTPAQVGEEHRSAVDPAMTEIRQGAVTFPDGRPTFTSSDRRMSLAVGELFQFDVGGYFQNRHSGVFEPPGARELNDGENLRRGRIYLVANFDSWTLSITPDFGGSPDGTPTLYEANLSYQFDPITLTIGYFKPYDTLARSQFPGDSLFMERPSSAFIASNVADGTQRASAGFTAATADYFIGSYLTGATYGSQDAVLLNRQQSGGTLRLATRPLRGEDWNLHVGFSGSTVFNFDESKYQPGGSVPGITLSDQPELRIDFNRLIDTGFIPAKTADTWGFEAAANWRNFLIEGEYIRIDVDPTVGPDLSFSGWYVEGSWVLTGERRPYIASSATYGRPMPAHPFRFSPDGGWGAWELAGRYSFTDLNSGVVYGGKQAVTTAGLSWYPNDHIRFILQGSYVDVNRLDATGKFQVGQSFWDIGLRSQVAY
jgi:phosphate-selective porin OprO and OprP